MTTTIGWNVDTQYDFMRPDGKLYVQGAEKIEPALAELTALFKKTGTVAINTADWHNKESKELSATPDYTTTFPEHCMEKTPGAAYVAATEPEKPFVVDWKSEKYLNELNGNPCRAGGPMMRLEDRFKDEIILGRRNFILYKDAFDVFTGTPFADTLLEATHADRVIVYGVATNVCVNFAVQGLLDRGKEVYVVKDAIKELPNLPLDDLVQTWEAKGAKFTTVNQVYSLLGGAQ